MAIGVVGLNHQRAPIEVRERLAFSAGELSRAVEALAGAAPEVVLLSTCNRTELYLADPQNGVDLGRAREALCRARGIPPPELDAHFYTYAEQEAVEHLFRVASGLDAMVLGETQIIGQVRDAYEAGRTGRIFNTLFQRALHVAGRVHSETSLGQGGVSVPSVAARLADRIFDALPARRLLVVGAGETGLLTLTAFGHRGVKDLRVANRTEARAHELVARFGGRAVPFEQLADALHQSDIIVTCVESAEPILTRAHVSAAILRRRGDPLLLIDLGVPRNIDPAAAGIENVYLFDLDDLQSIVGQSILQRQGEIDKSMQIILKEADDFMMSVNNLWVEEVLKQLREQFYSVGQQELQKITDSSARVEAEEIVRRVINKLLHTPTVQLKRDFQPGTPAEIIRRMFGLK
jgi:glutamyl-tRNA reductase